MAERVADAGGAAGELVVLVREVGPPRRAQAVVDAVRHDVAVALHDVVVGVRVVHQLHAPPLEVLKCKTEYN